MAIPKSVFLDIDSSIVENNLRIANNPEEEFNKIFGDRPSEYPCKVVNPLPGICVKTKELTTDCKVFVNICTTNAIPPPKDLSEEELDKIMNTDEITDYRVPMSIGDIRPEKDKKGDEVKTVDIAIHPDFLKKIETHCIFKSFFFAVVFQGLENKHGLICQDEKRVLINKKAYGKLQAHRIQQREIDEKMGKLKPSPITELTGGEKEADSKKVVIETISSSENVTKEPEYRLYKKKVGPNCLIGEFKFPDIISASQITVDVGEDRLLIESKQKGYLLDIFVPYCIRNEKCTSSFDKGLKILTVLMPVMGG